MRTTCFIFYLPRPPSTARDRHRLRFAMVATRTTFNKQTDPGVLPNTTQQGEIQKSRPDLSSQAEQKCRYPPKARPNVNVTDKHRVVASPIHTRSPLLIVSTPTPRPHQPPYPPLRTAARYLKSLFPLEKDQKKPCMRKAETSIPHLSSSHDSVQRKLSTFFGKSQLVQRTAFGRSIALRPPAFPVVWRRDRAVPRMSQRPPFHHWIPRQRSLASPHRS